MTPSNSALQAYNNVICHFGIILIKFGKYNKIAVNIILGVSMYANNE